MPATYLAFDLNVYATHDLPGLMPWPDGGEPDVYVRVVEALPPFSSPPKVVKPFTSFHETEFLLDLPSYGRFFVREGREIFVQPLTADWEHLNLFLQSTVFAVLLYQRDMLPYHMSGVLDAHGRVWLFAGNSRVGKSTTSLQLRALGYRFFTDDTVVFRCTPAGCVALPSFPVVKAWKNTLEAQHVYALEDGFLPNPEVEKYSIRVRDEYVPTPAPVAGIVLLEQAGSEIVTRNLRPREVLERLSQHVYRKQWVIPMGKQRVQFEATTALAQHVPVWEAVRPADRPTYDTFAEALHTQILNAGG